MTNVQIEIAVLNQQLELSEERTEQREMEIWKLNHMIEMLEADKEPAPPQFKSYASGGRKSYYPEVVPDNSEAGARERNQSLLN